jgi:hypothetical protein
MGLDLAGFYQVQLTVFAVDDARPDAGLIRSCTPSIVDIDTAPKTPRWQRIARMGALLDHATRHLVSSARS